MNNGKSNKKNEKKDNKFLRFPGADDNHQSEMKAESEFQLTEADIASDDDFYSLSPEELSDEGLQEFVVGHYLEGKQAEDIPMEERALLFQDVFLKSEYLLKEPEFQSIIIAPEDMICIYDSADKTVMAKHGNPDQMSEQEFDQVSEELILLMTDMALDNGLREKILAALYDTLDRGNKSKNSKVMADTAANLFILRNQLYQEMWSHIPICYGIVDRSMTTIHSICIRRCGLIYQFVMELLTEV